MPARRIVVRPRALRELEQAAEWYEAQRAGLGGTFVNSFREALALIVENPLQYQLRGRRTRRAPLRSFPHGLLYHVSDHEIVVLACFHSSRDPAEWAD
jgi:plasmid stabilization system protein ParE